MISICRTAGGFVTSVVKLLLDPEFVFTRYESSSRNLAADVLWNVLASLLDSGCLFSSLLWTIRSLPWCTKSLGGLFVTKSLFLNTGWPRMGRDSLVLRSGLLSALFIGTLSGSLVRSLYFSDLCLTSLPGALPSSGVKFTLGLEFSGVNSLLSRSPGIKSSQDFGLLLFDSYTGLLGRLLEPILTIGLVLLGRGPCVEPSNNAEGELLRGGNVEGARLAGPASQTA